MSLVVLQMAVMSKCNAWEGYAIVLLHKESRFQELKHIILPDNQTVHIQMLTLLLARRNVANLFSILRSMCLSANPTEAGQRYSVTVPKRTVGAWRKTEKRFLVPGAPTWKSALISPK